MRVFKEEQRFAQIGFILLIALSVLISVGLILREYTKENSTMNSVEFISILLFICICTTPIFFFKLKTRIDEKGIHYRFFPFHSTTKIIPWTEMESVTIRKYNAITKYGGWGLKGNFRRKRGKAVTVSGNTGIQLTLKNTQKLLIGTQKENDVKKVVATYASTLEEKS